MQEQQATLRRARARRLPLPKQLQRSAARARRPMSDVRERRGGCWRRGRAGTGRRGTKNRRMRAPFRITRAAVPRPGLWPDDEEGTPEEALTFEARGLWLNERATVPCWRQRRRSQSLTWWRCAVRADQLTNAAHHLLRPSRRSLPEKLLRSAARGGRISSSFQRPARFSHST